MNARPAPTATPIDPLLAGRWSRRTFSQQAVGAEQLTIVLEAARWAPFSSDLQPWRFIVCDRKTDANAYDRAFAGLVRSIRLGLKARRC
jgi:nitroreductase